MLSVCAVKDARGTMYTEDKECTVSKYVCMSMCPRVCLCVSVCPVSYKKEKRHQKRTPLTVHFDIKGGKAVDGEDENVQVFDFTASRNMAQLIN